MIFNPATTKYFPSFMLIPSLACPASCSYCFGPREGKTMDAMVASAAVAFMDSIMRETGQSKLRLTFHGGEPLLAGHEFFEDLFGEIERVFAGRPRQFALQSNLWLLDDRFCDSLKKHKVSIGTSLDGPEEINDSQRGPGSFARTMAGIQRAWNAGLTVNCIATFTRRNAERWEEIFDFFQSHNLPFSLHAAVGSLCGESGLEIDAGKWGVLLRQMLARYARERHSLRIEALDQLCQTTVVREGTVCALRDCFGMFLVIDPHGDIYPCQRMAGMDRFRLGSVFDQPTMADLAASRPARIFLEREERVRAACGGCEHFELCKGGCAYNAFANGDGDRDPLCEAYRGIFDDICGRLTDEMSSPENIELLAERGMRQTGHPLIHTGAIAELARKQGHPSQTIRTARRIVAAVELARCPDMELVSHRLVETGICRSQITALSSLENLKAAIDPAGKLNKLYLHITFRCQLQCAHCYSRGGEEDNSHEMSPDEIANLVAEGAAAGFQEIVITGGEPLIHRELQQVLKRLKETRHLLGKARLVLRTNLTMPLSSAEMVQIAGAFDQVTASVDGTPELHDARRGTGAFDRLHQNLAKWMQELSWQSALHHQDRMAELTLAASLRSKDARGDVGRSLWAFANSLGIRHVKMRPLLPLGRARNWDEPPTTEVLHMNLEPWEVLEQGFYPCANCGIGQNLYVEPDGAAFPCYAYHRPHSILGNVCRDGLAAVIVSENFAVLTGSTVDTNQRCRTCDVRYICGGACRAWSDDTAQFDLDAPPQNCDPLRERAERIYQEALAYLEEIANVDQSIAGEKDGVA